MQELHKQLQIVMAELAKYGSVNRKALDQYVSFTDQREELGRRKVRPGDTGGRR